MRNDLGQQLKELIPRMRRFACGLAGSIDHGDGDRLVAVGLGAIEIVDAIVETSLGGGREAGAVRGGADTDAHVGIVGAKVVVAHLEGNRQIRSGPISLVSNHAFAVPLYPGFRRPVGLATCAPARV